MADGGGIIITGIPVDDEANRARASALGFEGPWPAPYRGSALMECDMCGGRCHVGPKLQEVRILALAAGDDPPVLCLFCASLASAQGLTGLVVKLTDKEPGE
jgi:hypothetical protein